MKTKEEIVKNWLPRYTGMQLDAFGEYILLTNFSNYVDIFAEWHNVEIFGKGRAMQCATADNITMINFGMGSPNAATIMDLLTGIKPKACLFLGKCGGLRKNHLGDFILPMAAIRGEGTSNDYMPPEVPALPAFALQKAVSTTLRDNFALDYWTGTIYTTNRRIWEWDEDFKDYLLRIRCIGIDMETATLFTVAFKNKIPIGAILLVSDMPMMPEGVKTEASDKIVTTSYVDKHIHVGIVSLKQLINNSLTVKHLKF